MSTDVQRHLQEGTAAASVVAVSSFMPMSSTSAGPALVAPTTDASLSEAEAVAPENSSRATPSAANSSTTAGAPNTTSPAIRLTAVSKLYQLGTIGGRTLQADLQSRWARLRGREDPNLRIGTEERLVGQTFYALRDINLTIKQGERVGIIGANGAGKSTLLKLLSRITAPTEGAIDIWGRVSSMLEVGTGFHREMTGRENVYMNGAILGMSRSQIDERMNQIIAFSEVGEFIDTPVKRYSSGMFVKLAFSVAAHLNSEIMIMDEVLAVGDMAFQHKCLDRMREAADREGRTVLYVSHSMETIRRLCDRCIVLDQGRVIYDGEVEAGIAAYMDHSLADDAVDFDLASRAHAPQLRDTGLRMTRLVLEDKAMPTYEQGEDLFLRLWVETVRPLEKLSVQLTLRTDADVGLGTSWSSSFDLERAGVHEIALRMQLGLVAKGTFYGSIGVYRADELGRMMMLDHITHAFKLEVLGLPVWNVTAHGYIKLPSVELW